MRELISNARAIVRAYHREVSATESVVEIVAAFWLTACALACGLAFLIIVGGDHA
ncbi:hypothetical protein [Novosphingobium clariflavum]|uniref:Uncharacterized protein n=1 Tax=Novosphingobium clariflavum TaxID=2029884 RepID=A0ABV6SB05_9SPHN|nr:hypothetical protein [Novosphingobium clariflavum]